MKDLNYYLSLPYTIVLKQDEEGDFLAHLEEIPRCQAHGGTIQEAIDHLNEMKTLWFEECLESNQAIPEPVIEEVLPSGKWVQRVPRSLHKKLSELAKREGVSLNQLVSGVLAEAVGRRDAVVIDSPNVCEVRMTESPGSGWQYAVSHQLWEGSSW